MMDKTQITLRCIGQDISLINYCTEMCFSFFAIQLSFFNGRSRSKTPVRKGLVKACFESVSPHPFTC